MLSVFVKQAVERRPFLEGLTKEMEPERPSKVAERVVDKSTIVFNSINPYVIGKLVDIQTN